MLAGGARGAGPIRPAAAAGRRGFGAGAGPAVPASAARIAAWALPVKGFAVWYPHTTRLPAPVRPRTIAAMNDDPTRAATPAAPARPPGPDAPFHEARGAPAPPRVEPGGDPAGMVARGRDGAAPDAVVHVLGASGRSGAALCRALLAAGGTAVPVVRSAARWAATGMGLDPVLADLADAGALRRALAGARLVACCAHARHAAAVLAAAPPDASCVFLGSTRRFTRWPDAHGGGVMAGEAALLGSGRRGVMLHPTMIYGAEGEDNVRRLAALLRRLPRLRGRPLVPLPGGGRALVQPVFQGDVTRALLAALGRDWAPGAAAVVLCGPEPLPYAAFVAAVARAAGMAPPLVLPVPAAPLIALSPLTAVLPRVPRVRAAELRRLGEDKAFDPGPMRRVLGVEPVGLAEGLALTFGAGR